MRRFSTLLAALLCSGSVLACDYPVQLVEIPEGETATKDEMIAAQKSVKAYMAAMDVYIKCLEAMLEGKTDEELARLQQIQTMRHNSAVEAMEIVADRFNVQVRAYKDNN